MRPNINFVVYEIHQVVVVHVIMNRLVDMEHKVKIMFN